MPAEIKININPVNLVIISGILQCIILACILMLYRKGNLRANRFIGLFVLICSLHFSWSLIIDTNLADVVKPIFWFPYAYLLAIGPLLYFYTRSLTAADFRFGVKDLIHFLPVAIEVLVQLYFIRESIRLDVVHYVLPGFLLFRIIEFAGTIVSIFFYGKKSLALLRVHEMWLQENFSNQRDITLSWLYKLIQYLRVLWIFWLLFELSFLFFLQFQLHYLIVYLLLYLLLGVITYSSYWIGLQGLYKSEVMVERKPIEVQRPESASVYSRLTEGEIKSHVNSLNHVMQGEKLYLHETLSLRTLAARLQMDPNLVSYILNTILHKSFNDYVNEWRIEEVKRRMDDPAFAHFKIVEIAYESGFNSKATFNRVFKKITGKSPSEYKKVVL